MIYSASGYAEKFTFNGKHETKKNIIRRCGKGYLPKDHIPRRLSGRTGMWIIEVLDKPIQETPEEILKDKPSSISTGHFSW